MIACARHIQEIERLKRENANLVAYNVRQASAREYENLGFEDFPKLTQLRARAAVKNISTF